MITNDKNVKSESIRSGLISLIDSKKTTFHGGFAEIVRIEFDLICEARENGASRSEIVEALGFPGKENVFSVAFCREKARREKKKEERKEVTPEKKKWIPTPKPKEEKEESPGSDRPVPASGVRLVEGKAKDGACEAFRRLPSID